MSVSRSPEDNKAIYDGLRIRALSVNAQDIGIQPVGETVEPYGVVMEFYRQQTVVTLATFSTGDASLYFSSGGGILGGIQYESVRSAANGLISLSKTFLPHFVRTETFPAPSEGAMRFFILTTKGVFTAEAPEASVTTGRDSLSPLFGTANAVITAFRIADQR